MTEDHGPLSNTLVTQETKISTLYLKSDTSHSVFLFLLKQVSRYSPDWSRDLATLLPHLPKCWEHHVHSTQS